MTSHEYLLHRPIRLIYAVHEGKPGKIHIVVSQGQVNRVRGWPNIFPAVRDGQATNPTDLFAYKAY